MSIYTPQEIAQLAAKSGQKKAQLPLLSIFILGTFGGAFVALGYLLDIHVVAAAPESWGGIAHFLGASVFPIGLILVILAGGELVTSNMMAVSLACFSKKVAFPKLVKNITLVTCCNFLGALFVAYFFGHILGLTEGRFLTKTVSIAQAKLNDPFFKAFISGIGCNWLVGLAYWLSLASKDFTGKVIGIWFPVMTFVAIGFQHVVANMFVIPAAIFAGQATWMEFFPNMIVVFLGNLVGGVIFVALPYFLAYRQQPQPQTEMKVKKPSASA